MQAVDFQKPSPLYKMRVVHLMGPGSQGKTSRRIAFQTAKQLEGRPRVKIRLQVRT
jgi:hypothetical protein